MRFRSKLIVIPAFAIAAMYPYWSGAVTDAELEALEKQLEQQEEDLERRQKEMERKKQEQEKKASAEAERKAREAELRRKEQAMQEELEKIRQQEEQQRQAAEAQRLEQERLRQEAAARQAEEERVRKEVERRLAEEERQRAEKAEEEKKRLAIEAVNNRCNRLVGTWLWNDRVGTFSRFYPDGKVVSFDLNKSYGTWECVEPQNGVFTFVIWNQKRNLYFNDSTGEIKSTVKLGEPARARKVSDDPEYNVNAEEEGLKKYLELLH